MNNSLPLIGKTILVTRGGEKGHALADNIKKLGGVVNISPLIDFRANQDRNAMEYARKLQHYDWIIFTSQNGVKFFFEQLVAYLPNFKPEQLINHIAAVGKKTKEAIENYNLKVDFVPKRYSAVDFISEFFAENNTVSQVLIPKGNLASKTIANGFRKHHMLADEWIVYTTFFPEESKEELAGLLIKHQIDYATFTSPSCFHHFMEVVKEHSLEAHIKNIGFVTIGAVTRKTVEDYGLSVAISPNIYTIESMLKSLCSLVKCKEEIKNE